MADLTCGRKWPVLHAAYLWSWKRRPDRRHPELESDCLWTPLKSPEEMKSVRGQTHAQDDRDTQHSRLGLVVFMIQSNKETCYLCRPPADRWCQRCIRPAPSWSGSACSPAAGRRGRSTGKAQSWTVLFGRTHRPGCCTTPPSQPATPPLWQCTRVGCRTCTRLVRPLRLPQRPVPSPAHCVLHL